MPLITICAPYHYIIPIFSWLIPVINLRSQNLRRVWIATLGALYQNLSNSIGTSLSDLLQKILIVWSIIKLNLSTITPSIHYKTAIYHDDVIKRKHFPRYWPFVRGIHRSPVNSPHKGQWRGALMFSLICVWINGWVNNRDAGDWRRYRAHHGVIVMQHDGP